MKSYRRISLIFVLAALADGATAQAQTRGRRPLQSRHHAGCSADFRWHVAQREIGRPVRSEDGRGSRRHRDSGFTAAVQQPSSSPDSGADGRDAAGVDMARIAARGCSTGDQGICTAQLLSGAAAFARHPAASHSDGPRRRSPAYLHSQPVDDGRRQPPWPLVELRQKPSGTFWHYLARLGTQPVPTRRDRRENCW